MEGHNRPIRHSKKLLSLEQEAEEEKRKHLLIQRILLFRIHYSYRMAGIRSGLDRRQAKNNENILFVPTVVLLTQGIAKNWGRASMRQKKAIEQKTTDLACTVIHTGAQRGKKPKASELLSTLRFIVLSDWKGFGLTHFVLLHSNLVANRWIPSSREKGLHLESSTLLSLHFPGKHDTTIVDGAWKSFLKALLFCKEVMVTYYAGEKPFYV